MKLNTLVILSLVIVTQCLAFEKEEGVYVLTDSNFDAFLEQHKVALIEFYAPWCGHCKKLAPEYSKAASEFANKNSHIVLAKVDSTVQTGIASRFEIQGYPTLKYFVDGVPAEYNGGRTASEIVSWLEKRQGPAAETVKTSEELAELKRNHQVLVVFFGSDSDADIKIFNSVALSNDEVKFVKTDDEAIAAEHSQNAKIALFKQFDEQFNSFTGDLTVSALQAFVDDNSFPLVMPFNDRAIKRVFQQGNPTIFFFSDESEACAEAESIFYQVAADYKGKIVFSVSRKNDGFGHYQRLADFIGVNTAQVPQVMIIQTTNEVNKYAFSKQITTFNLKQYIDSFLDGKLEKFLKSEEIPEKNDEPVKVIVGKSFNSIVLESKADVMVEFYAPWCGHCQKLAPIYEEVAANLQSNPNIILAKVDATANEIPGSNIKGFPTIKFYQNGKKNAPIDFDGERTVEGFLKWIKEHSTHDEVVALPKVDDL